MRKFLLVTILFSLYSLQSFAEKTISKDDFNHFVDYAICKYVLVFTNVKEKEVYKKIEPILGKVDLKELDKVPNYDSIKSLLPKESLALELADTIRVKSRGFEESGNNVNLIELLGAKSWYNVSLIETATNIQNEIRKTLETVSSPTIEMYKERHEMLHKQLEELEKRQQRNEAIISNYQRFRSIVFAICSFFVILFILLFLIISRINKKFLKKYITQTTTEVKPYILTEKDVQNITNEVWNRLERRRKEQPAPLPITDNSNKIISPKPNYLKGKNGKIFSRVEHTPENSFFKLFGERAGSTEVEFEFSGNEEEAIARRIFHDDICKILSGNYQNARSVKMVERGRVKRIGEQWEVIKPISIKLI